MHYYEVLIADGRYHSSAPLIYSSSELLDNLSVVSVPLRNRMVTGYVINQVSKPVFSVKPIKTTLSASLLPYHCIQLAEWIRDYYCCTYGEALRQFAPASTVIRRSAIDDLPLLSTPSIDLEEKLTMQQQNALDSIAKFPSTTMLLHGQTGSGKTRVYLELAQATLRAGKSVILLVPEIALTAQLVSVAAKKIKHQTIVFHSDLSSAERKKLWFTILESDKPLLIIGPRSALFVPLESLGLIIVDEAHEPAYKQEQAPRYNALRVASQLGLLTGSKVVMGSATPSITDYYVASKRNSIIEMPSQARESSKFNVNSEVIDLRDKAQFKKTPYLSDRLSMAISQTLDEKQQVLIYYNRRGSARIILCENCGWQLLCPHCDVSLVYHNDQHLARCHICGHSETPPKQCPQCSHPEIIYKSIGSKTLHQIISSHFPSAIVKRFDSDNLAGERLNDVYEELHRGDTDILVGTQLLAKGLDLPRLGLVGVIAADASLGLPDFSAEERTYQLLYQVMGRVGRGHIDGKVIVQTYEPDSLIIKSALERNWKVFYEHTLLERQTYRFPPFSYLLKLACRRATLKGAETATANLKETLLKENLPVEIIGPTPSFYLRRGKYYYYQLIVKSKDRKHLVRLAGLAPAGWQCDIDPIDLL